MTHLSNLYQSRSQLAGFTMAIMTALSMLSCKADVSVSGEKSLNNFARNSGEISRNVCRGDNKVVKGIHQEWDHVDFTRVPQAKVPELKRALESSLSAVPASLQELFFGLGGTIVFSEDLDKPVQSSSDLSCDRSGNNTKFASEGTNRIEACWTTDSKTQDIVILMNPTAESVHHSTVRIFGYILSQILTKINVNEESVIIMQRDEQFDALMSDISTAVLADVRRPGSKYKLSVNESLIHTEDFKYFVFAESFDSYYCNSQLRRDMAKADEFPKTFALFEAMDQELKAVSITAQNTEGASEVSNDGFSLQGASAAAAFNLRFFGGIFRGIGRMGGFLGRGLFRGVGFLGRGVAGLGRGIFRGGAAVVRGGGRLLGGAARGLGGLFGGGGGGGGLISLISSFAGAGGGGGGGVDLGGLLGGGGGGGGEGP